MVADVLNSDVFKSDGSKSSTNSLRVDFSSREKLLLTSFNSIAEFGFEYFSILFKTIFGSSSFLFFIFTIAFISLVIKFNYLLKRKDWLILIYLKNNSPDEGIIIEDKTIPEQNISHEFKPNEIFKASDMMVDALTKLLDRERDKKKAS